MTPIERFNQACENHDLDAVLATLAEDIVFESTEPPPDGRRYQGKAAVAAVIGPILTDPDAHFEIEETIATGDRVIQLNTYRWASGHISGVDIFRIKGEQIVQIRSYVKG